MKVAWNLTSPNRPFDEKCPATLVVLERRPGFGIPLPRATLTTGRVYDADLPHFQRPDLS
jgi:hypothetical protein